MHPTDCFICGRPLVYDLDTVSRTCMVCGTVKDSNARCEAGHFICDACHSGDAIDLIEKFCLTYSRNDALDLARQLMQMQPVKMHGPEHHFLVPAVLLTVYYNSTHRRDELPVKLSQARNRAQKILGGFCGYYGTCGAAVGTGLAVSLITDTTPLSADTWRLCNLATSRSLAGVAKYNGPRCCKRDTFLSLTEAIHFFEQELNLSLPHSTAPCTFSNTNRECLKSDCDFFLKTTTH